MKNYDTTNFYKELDVFAKYIQGTDEVVKITIYSTPHLLYS